MSDDRKVALVIGANRGIGLHLVRALRKDYDVWGSVRPQSKYTSSAKELSETGAKVLEIDYLEEQSIIEAVKAIEASGRLDVLINNGGVGTAPRSWKEETADTVLTKFKIMALGPFLATQHFTPLLAKGSPGRIVNISSDLGSIQDTDGGRMAYRMAKVSLNTQTATLAVDFKASNMNIAITSVHPGDVPTDLSHHQGDTNIVDSVNGILSVLEKLNLDNSGQFLHYTGEKMNW